MVKIEVHRNNNNPPNNLSLMYSSASSEMLAFRTLLVLISEGMTTIRRICVLTVFGEIRSS
jgi:hypothetical protein